MQLAAGVAYDPIFVGFVCERALPVAPANRRESVMHWFVDREDGFATADDVDASAIRQSS